MYRIIKQDGTEISVTENVNYIRIADNGCYVLTDKGKAEGIAVDGTPYSIIAHEPLKGAEDTVVISEFDGATMFYKQINLIENAAIQLEKIAVSNGDMLMKDVPDEWQKYFMTEDDEVDVSDGNGTVNEGIDIEDDVNGTINDDIEEGNIDIPFKPLA